MSQPAVSVFGASATATDPLALLQQRLVSAEEETEALLEDMGALGVSRCQIVGSVKGMASAPRSVRPLETQGVSGDHGLLWEDSLVSRVKRIESLLQILELTFFRMETDRKPDPPGVADVKRQQESVGERGASTWEARELREQLRRARRERDDARTQLWRLRDTVEAAAAAETDVALAAEELKVIKLEMSRKLLGMREQTRHEAARCAQLLQRVEEMEREREAERRQVLRLEADRRALRAEVRSVRQQLEKEKERSREVEELCRQLRDQTVTKDSPVSEFTTEPKEEGIREGERPQRRGCESDLQLALRREANVRLELDKLRGEHSQLLQNAAVTQEAAAAQTEPDERTIERLQAELSSAKNQEEAMGSNPRWSHNQCVCGPAGGAVIQNIPTVQTSRGRGQKLTAPETDSRQQARTEITTHQAEVEKLQRLLTSTCSENNRALACTQKALDSAREENRRLVQSVEHSVLTNSSLRRKLQRAREQHQASVTLRDEELREAQRKIRDLCAALDAVKQQTAGGSSVKKLRGETSEVLCEAQRDRWNSTV